MGQLRRHQAPTDVDVRRDLPREQLDLHLRPRLSGGADRARRPSSSQGCCSYGAHLVQREGAPARRARPPGASPPTSGSSVTKGADGTTRVKRSGEIVTRLDQDACIFLNRPDFHRGPGCALHVLALDNDESYIPLKPDVCWQLPLHRDDHDDSTSGHVITRISQWERRDWGGGGEEFHWWCTEAPEAFTGQDSRGRLDGRRAGRDGRPERLRQAARAPRPARGPAHGHSPAAPGGATAR